jgi:hypothetical protein
MAGDLKACFTGVEFDFAVSTAEMLSDFGRLGTGSEGRGSADGRLRDVGTGFGIAAKGVSSSESEESFGRADGCRDLRAVSAWLFSLCGIGRSLRMRSIVWRLCFLYLSFTMSDGGTSALSGS